MTNQDALYVAQARVEEAQQALTDAREAAHALREQAAKLERDAENALWTAREEKERAEALVWLDEDRRRFPTPTGAHEEVWAKGFTITREVFRHVGWTPAGSLLIEERRSYPRSASDPFQYAVRRNSADFKTWCERFNVTPPPKEKP